MNSQLFFCCEPSCNAESHVSGGRCDECFELFIAKLCKEHNPPRCEWCHEVFESENSVFLPSESGRFCNKWCEAGWRNEHTSYSIDSALPKCCADCGVRREATEPELLCDWFCKPCWQVRFGKKHVCSGEMDYELGHKICDDRDDPLCPQHLALVESCETCGCTAEFRDGERVCWCDSCQRTGCVYKHHCSGESEYRPEERICDDRADPRCPQHIPFSSCDDCGKQFSVGLVIDPTRCPSCFFSSKNPCQRRNSIVSPRACADCDEKPEDGHFPFFRGDDPLCADCEEEFYGPPSPEERRERTGRCCQCNYFFELICSSDRKDLCYKCK